MLIMTSSPIFVLGVVFTWPKLVSIFFVLSALLLILELPNLGNNSNYWFLIGLCLSLAYLSHPMTIITVPIFAIYAFCSSRKNKFKLCLKLLTPFVFVYFLWKLWCINTGLPASDLFEQNFSFGGLSLQDSLLKRSSSFAQLFSIRPILETTILSLFSLGQLPQNIQLVYFRQLFADLLISIFSFPIAFTFPIVNLLRDQALSRYDFRLSRALIALFIVIGLFMAIIFSRGGVILWHGYLIAVIPFIAYQLAQLISLRFFQKYKVFLPFAAFAILSLNVLLICFWINIQTQT